MKTCIKTISLFFLALFSISSFAAEKIVISGEPVVIQKEGDVYVPTTTLTTTTDYYYFTVDNSQRVCYKTVQPSLAKVDAGVLSVRVGGDTVQVHCYNTSPDYFTISTP